MSYQTNTKGHIANLAFIVATMIWGSSYVVVKNNLNSVHSVTLLCYQCSIATIILGSVLLLLKKKLFHNFKKGLVLGSVLSCFFLGQAICLYYTTVINASFITKLFVVFIPFYSYLFLKKKSQPSLIIAIIFALIGFWFLTGGISIINRGDLIALASTIIGGSRVFIARKFMQEQGDPMVLNFQQLLVMSVISIVVVAGFHLPLTIKTSAAFWGMIYLTLFVTLLCYVIQFYALKFSSPTTISMIATLVPVFGVISACIFGGESLTLHAAIGGSMILLAILISESQSIRTVAANRIASWKKVFQSST